MTFTFFTLHIFGDEMVKVNNKKTGSWRQAAGS